MWIKHVQIKMIPNKIILFIFAMINCFENTLQTQSVRNLVKIDTINGTTADPGQFPYLAFLEIKEAETTRYGLASLISDRYLLSTAFFVIRAQSINIILGAQNWKVEESEQQRFTISSESIIFPETIDNQHDISILQLPKRAKFTDRVQPVLLPRRRDAGQSYVGVTGIISGWGPPVRGSLEKPGDFVTYSQVKVMENSHCGGNLVAPPKVLCIDERWISDWENASPLVIKESGSDFVQIALFSYLGALQPNSTVWNLFTRLNEHLGFIERFTNIHLRP